MNISIFTFLSLQLIYAWDSSDDFKAGIGQWAQIKNHEISSEHEKKNFYYEGGQRPKQVCPEKLWIVHFWRYSKPDWTHPGQPPLADPAWEAEGLEWTRWSQEVTSKPQKFCDSVNFSCVNMRDLTSSE